MSQPPDKSRSDRSRTPQPVRSANYFGLALQDLVNFFSSYHRQPQPEGLDVVLQRVTELELLTMPEHRFGIAGAVHAIMSLHPAMQAEWRKKWPKQMAVIDSCRPAEEDSEVARPPEIDYLWMYGTTLQDEYTIDRIIRIAMRTDMVGDAAVRVIHYHATHPLVLVGLARAAATTTAAMRADESLPHGPIKTLAQFAAGHPVFQATILCVGWRTAGKVLVAKTPDGQLPQGFPTIWAGHMVVGAQATKSELETWRKMRDEKERP